MEIVNVGANFADKVANEIPQWHPKNSIGEVLKKNNSFTMVLTGSRASGKSELLKYILINKECGILDKFNLVVVFSKTLANGFYSSFIKSKLMFKEFRKDVIDEINRVSETHKAEGKPFRYLIILDDIIDGKIKYMDAIGDLFYCGRHFGASTIFLTQKLSFMSTGWLANTNFFVNLFTGSRMEKKFVNDRFIVDALYEKFPEKKSSEIEHIGYYVLTKICQNYNSLVIEPYNPGNKLFRFKAKLTKIKPEPSEIKGFFSFLD